MGLERVCVLVYVDTFCALASEENFPAGRVGVFHNDGEMPVLEQAIANDR